MLCYCFSIWGRYKDKMKRETKMQKQNMETKRKTCNQKYAFSETSHVHKNIIGIIF